MTSSSPKRSLPRTVLLLVVLVTVICSGATWRVGQWNAKRSADARVAADVEHAVNEALASLDPESEIINRFGAFRSLQGSGFTRPSYAWQLITRLELYRKAMFAKDTVGVVVTIANQGPIKVSK